MAKVYQFMANGTEEIEALTTIDVLRRGGVEALTVSITGSESYQRFPFLENSCVNW